MDSYQIDSFALTNEEIGNPIYPPMRNALLHKGYAPSNHRAKRITQKDVEQADFVLYMDSSNASLIRWMFPKQLPKFKLITDYAPNLREIEDPWYSGRYEKVLLELEICLEGLLKSLH